MHTSWVVHHVIVHAVLIAASAALYEDASQHGQQRDKGRVCIERRAAEHGKRHARHVVRRRGELQVEESSGSLFHFVWPRDSDG
jgi:hypothetical protein